MYNFQGSPSLNPNLGQGNLHRIGWASNNRDLILDPVVMADSGTYECSNNLKSWRIKFDVRGRDIVLWRFHS